MPAAVPALLLPCSLQRHEMSWRYRNSTVWRITFQLSQCWLYSQKDNTPEAEPDDCSDRLHTLKQQTQTDTAIWIYTAVHMLPMHADEHLRAGHPQSLQNLDFGKQTPRPPLGRAEEAEGEEPQSADREGAQGGRSPSRGVRYQHPTRPASATVGRSLHARHVFLHWSTSIVWHPQEQHNMTEGRPRTLLAAMPCLL